MTITPPDLDDAQLASIRAKIDRPIVLVGLMGVGKSTVGKRLAEILDFSFVDADAEIEEAAQMSISEIFDRFGEAYFRDGERRVIDRLMELSRGIIATGGGAFCNDETRAHILDRGLAVWLDADIDVLAERVARKDTRPLLRNGDPAEILAKLHRERAPFYAQAPIHVRSGSGPHQATVNRILEGLMECQ